MEKLRKIKNYGIREEEFSKFNRFISSLSRVEEKY